MVFFLIAANLPGYAFAGSLDKWTIQSPLPTGNQLSGITYGNNTFVAVGISGTIITSSDGTSWTNQTSGTPNQLNSITYGNNMFVAVGAAGTIITSSDGMSWTSRTSGIAAMLISVAYGNGMYVAVGENGTIVTSNDGVNWTSRSSGITDNLNGVTFGNNTYVAVGNFGKIVTSSNGTNWTSRTSNVTYHIRSIAYKVGKFVAVTQSGPVVLSSDGISWMYESSGTANAYYSIIYANNTFVAVGVSGKIITSSDGTSWTSQTSGIASNQNLYGIAYGNSTYVAVGTSGNIVTSSNGVNWTSQNKGTTMGVNGVAYGLGKYVAVGFSGDSITSSDGANWTSLIKITSAILNSVTYGSNMFVAVGSSGGIFTSSNGTNWTMKTSGTSSDLLGVTYGNGTYVAVGASGKIVTSSDGTSWTSRTSNTTNYLTGVTYGNGMYVAVGYNGTIVTSNDGVNWTSRTSNTTNNLTGVTSGNNTYVAVGNTGTILVSSDGANWTSRTSNTTNHLNSIVYENGTYVAVGNSGTILTASDEVSCNAGVSWASWTSQPSGTTGHLKSITYGNGTFVTAGMGGLIMTSDIATQNSAVSPSTCNFDKNTANTSVGHYQDVSATLTLNGNTLSSISNGAAVLVLNTDYTVSDNTVTIKKEYLAEQAPGTTNLTFIFSAGNTQTLTITISDTGPQSSTISPNTGGFDKNMADTSTGHYQDVSTTLTLNGNTLSGIANGATALLLDTDYTLSSNTVTIKKEYLAQQAPGTTSLTFTFSAGHTQTLTITVSDTTMTDAEAVAADKAALEVSFGSGDSATNVTKDLTLPVTGASGTTITWSSSDATVVDEDGKVTRPPYTAGDKEVTLTATITKGGEVETKIFTITVKASLPTDAEAVAAAKLALVVGFESGDSAASVTADLTLPVTGASGTTISWSSNDSTVVDEDGKVTRPSYTAGDKEVTLTATITKGGVTETKTFTVKVKASLPTDAEAVAAAKLALAVSFGSGDSATNVTKNLTLPVTGTSGTTITWSSNDSTVVDEDGIVTRPSYSAGDKEVTLTATITKGGVTETKTFTVKVKANPQTNAEAVADDKAALEVSFGSGDSATNVTKDLTLPAAGASGTTITWSSSDATVVDEDGKVTRPSYTAGDKEVTLTATITKGGVTETKTFTVKVKANPQTNAEAVADDKAALEVSFGSGDSATNVTKDLTLPVTGASGTTISWSSNDATVVDEDGKVTRPSYTAGDKEVTLTATITKGGVTETKTFTVKVKANPQTNAEAVADDKAALEVSFGSGDSATNVTKNLTLPVTGASGTTITWSSNDSTVIAPDGKVTRPSYTAGDKEVTLTATITIGGVTETKTFTVKVKAQTAPANDGGNAGSTPSPSGDTVIVLVNGKQESAGTATTGKRNDQTVLTITVDQKKLGDKLAAEGQGAVITIPANKKSDVVIGELNGQMVKNMENQKAILEIKTDHATYKLPAQQMNINAISEQIGKSAALQDIKVQVEIAAPTNDSVKVVENAAAKGTFTLVVPSVEFTVRATYGEKTIDVSKFDVYVERTIAIPDGVDPKKITTGVVVNSDGTVRHVPTKIVLIDGKYYAVINSLTNSMYSVVWHPVEFNDVAGHWAQIAVNDMGSRMIIEGTGGGQFSPNRDITRAEFTAIIVRALGLKLENGSMSFSDVKTTDWYSNAIQTAYAYGLIGGNNDGTFCPNDKITREQAMVILSKAMKITGLKSKLSAQSGDATLRLFTDASEVSAWAQSSVADNIQAGIASGKSATKLAPKDFMTRAEVATIIQRLLQKSDLI
ncbi:immunoglobulin-like domain-containing protein [Cohnella soli]|uniref:Immunoglobulin-like domain-containing protein n=1 Tax=Cohnella soli TaxID=425005 RepID=A0ABW0HU45_9BACL